VDFSWFGRRGSGGGSYFFEAKDGEQIMGKRFLTNFKKMMHLIAGIAFVVTASDESWAEPQPGQSEQLRAYAEEHAAEEHESLKMLSGYLTQAALQNPELESAFYRWRAAMEKLPQVKALPDPRFTYEYYLKYMEIRAEYMLSQSFPWFGTLSLKEEMAAKEAEALKAEYDALKLKVFFEIKNAFYEYAYLALATEITRQDIELVKYLESVARARYSAGVTPYADVLKTHVQLGKLEDELKTIRDMRRPTMAKLTSALNLPHDTELPLPPSVPVMLISISDEEILSQFSEHNPQIKKALSLEAREKSGINLARKDFFPEFELGVKYEESDGIEDPLSASITVNIPFWWEKRRAAVRENEAMRLSAEKSSAALRQNLTTDIQLALYKYRDAQRKIDLYQNNLIPTAEQALAVTLEAFQAGTRSSLDLIDAEKTLLEFELAFVRALADQAQKLAELEMLLGKEIPCSIHGVVLPGQGREPK
jgi:outer membrane protein TolC